MNRRSGWVIVALVVAMIGWRWCREDASTSKSSEVRERATLRTRSRSDRPKATLSGQVSRKAGGEIAGATVTITSTEPKSRFVPVVAVTDGGGKWTVPELAHGAYVVGAHARGFVPAYKPIEVSGPSTVDLVMEAGGATVRGTVTDIGGGPIANARVAAEQSSREAAVTVLTDARGGYELALAEGRVWLRVGHDDYAPARAHLDLIAGKQFLEDFVLEPGGTIRGHVVTRDGARVPGAEVTASRTRAYEDRWYAEERTDDDGAFEFRSVPAGVIDLSAQARNHATATSQRVALGLGEVRDVDIVVSPAFVISGRAIAKGSAIGLAGVEVALFGTRSSSTATTDSSGTFELPGVLPGTYAVNSRKGAVPVSPLDGPAVMVVDRDVNDVVLELDLGVRVTGRVEPAMKASVRSASCKVASTSVETDASGTFAFEHVGAGTCSLAATGADGSEGRVAITVSSQELSNVVVALEPRASVSGQVVDRGGAPVAGAWVGTHASEPRYAHRAAVTANDGTFRITGLEPGKHVVVAGLTSLPEFLSKTEVTLGAGEQRTGVTITIERPTLQIRGTVVDASRKPVADARVTAFLEVPGEDGKIRSRGWIPAVMTTPDGAFTIPNLRAGAYTIVARSPRESAYGEQMHVEAGGALQLVLAPMGTLEGTVMIASKPVNDFRVSCELDLTACGCWRAGSEVRGRFEAGAYRLEHLPPGRYTCTIRSDVGWHTSTLEIAGPTRLDVAFDPVGSIVGTAVDVLTGAPLANIYVLPADGGGWDRILGGLKPTDASGRFRVDGVHSGKVELMQRANQLQDDFLLDRPITVEPGQTTDLGIIELPAFARPAGTLGCSTRTDPRGFRVTSIETAGPAEAAGLREGDLITAINGRPSERLRDFWWLPLYVVGQTYKLTLERGVTLTVVAVRQ